MGRRPGRDIERVDADSQLANLGQGHAVARVAFLLRLEAQAGPDAERVHGLPVMARDQVAVAHHVEGLAESVHGSPFREIGQSSSSALAMRSARLVCGSGSIISAMAAGTSSPPCPPPMLTTF